MSELLTSKNLVFLLEEESAKVMLEGILPRLLGDNFGTLEIKYIVFEGKQDLEKQVERKLKGWNNPNSYFLIMRDQDSGDCFSIKNNLLKKIAQAGKQECSLVRIACCELESFYLGDLNAVSMGLSISNIAKSQDSQKYRQPDRLTNATEELTKLTQKKYQKISGSRLISQHLVLDGMNCSYSFNMLLAGIRKLIINE